MGSLRTIGQGLNFDTVSLNLGIGSVFTSNTRLSVINNNPQSWRTAIFKNTPTSDYISIGTYNSNLYIAGIDSNLIFKDLYLNNVGITSQPSTMIGNIIINGKTTIGINSNNSNLNHLLDVYTNNSNIAIFRNSNYNLSIGANSSNIILDTNAKRLTINSDVYISGFMIGSNYLSNVSNNPLSYKMPGNWIKTNSESCITTNNLNELELNIDTNTGLFINANKKLSFSGTINVIGTGRADSYWQSNNASEIYFKNEQSYVGIGYSYPKSHLMVGNNGNLLKVTSLLNNDIYFSQLGTNDLSTNNTNIRLIKPNININSIANADVSLSSGSIYYTICGNNPIHNFNYEINGNKTELVNINKNGLVSIQSNLIIGSNIENYSEKLRVYGNVSIQNLTNVPASLIVGQSNAETFNYSLYVNNNAKFGKVVIGNVINSFEGFPMINEYPLNIYGNIGITGNLLTTSDERIKTNIKTIENGLDTILKCRGVYFNYLETSNKNEIGVIAQEIEKVIPEIVETNKNGYKNVNYLSIIGFLIEAIKDLNNKINYIR